MVQLDPDFERSDKDFDGWNLTFSLKKINELKTVKTNVSTKYEIAGITAKVDGSHAVLFEKRSEENGTSIE